MNLGGWSLPRETPRNAPMPSFSTSAFSMTLILSPASRATFLASSASRVGVKLAAGSETRSRAKFTAPPMTSPFAAPAWALPLSAGLERRRTTSSIAFLSFSLLYFRNRYVPKSPPSTITWALSPAPAPLTASSKRAIATFFAPRALALAIPAALAIRRTGRVSLSFFPRPTTTAAWAGILPWV